MNKKILFILLFTILKNTYCQNNTIKINEEKTSSFYNYLISKNNISLLKLFTTQMPKGGDLHHHYSGSIYAETYLEWIKANNWFIDSTSFNIAKKKHNKNIITIDSLIKNNTLYRKLLTLWSSKDYNNHFHNQTPPDENFFSTFNYFGKIAKHNRIKGLKIIKNRAIKENVQYIETMLDKPNIKDLLVAQGTLFEKYKNKLYELNKKLLTKKNTKIILEEIDQFVLKNKNIASFLNKTINSYVKQTKKNHSTGNIDTKKFKMRYQTYCVRNDLLINVYLNLLASFKAAEKSDLIVGVNLLSPENDFIAIRDYTIHMKMYKHLKNKKEFKKVRRSLHAGELTLGMVKPKDLTFHIKEALNIAGAERIGHGVDIAYEENSIESLNKMKNQKIAVEINLTSNEFILGVKKEEHPYNIYTTLGVPIVISTDDSGVSRNNLSNEYLLLVKRYKPSYQKIKEYVYNSIAYSFLTENEKISQKKLLDKKFEDFENLIADLSNSIHLKNKKL